MLGQDLWVRDAGSHGGHPSLQAHGRRSLESPASTPAFLGPAWSRPRGSEQVPGPGWRDAAASPRTAAPWPRGSVFPGAPSVVRSPGLPAPAVPPHCPTQGPRGQSASPPLSRAPSCARAAGSRRSAPRSAVTVVSVLASPASTTSGGPQAVLHPRTEPCPLPTVPEVLQLSDALRDDVLPELGVRLEDHEGGSPGCDEGRCVGLPGGAGFRDDAFYRVRGAGLCPLGIMPAPPLS